MTVTEEPNRYVGFGPVIVACKVYGLLIAPPPAGNKCLSYVPHCRICLQTTYYKSRSIVGAVKTSSQFHYYRITECLHNIESIVITV